LKKKHSKLIYSFFQPIGSVDASQFQLEFCTKGEKNPTAFDRAWPKGDYCIFKYGDCPAGNLIMMHSNFTV